MMVLYPYGLRKALTLSYDDGVETDIELIRILDEYGILATFNLNSGWFAPEGTVYPAGTIYRRMSESAIKALYAGGRHEVASHALTHASLSAIPAPRIAYEVLADRDNLEKLFGKIVRGFAYPYGTYSDEAVDTLRTDGYELATMWVQAADDDLRAFLTSGGWEADGAHQEVAVDEEGRHLKLVRLHTDITPA